MKRKTICVLLLAAGIASGSPACEECVKIIVKNSVASKVTYAGLKDVRLLDSPFKHAMGLNAEWMLELDMDRLLSNFRKNAGLTPKAEPYGSWESMGIAGHTLGHYLTAASQQYAATGDGRFRERTDYIVAELDSCQAYFVNGFIGGMPGGDKVFKEVKKGIIRSKGFDLNGIWVPWYNQHKTMTGLHAAYLLTGNETARKVLVHLADYLADIVAGLSDEQIQLMLDCEYGGMNEAFAQVYALTGDRKYLDASYVFYHKKVQDKLAQGVDALQGLHSNTQIPKLVGSALQYQLTGNVRDYRIADFAWNTLVHHHSYANGGNSMGEYLSVPDKLSDRLGTNTCETCNTYNMLKLTQFLYEWTGNPHYLDYYERALYNHILASQNPEDGRTCYFVSLGMGTKKNFYGKTNNFTCCMGSGFENHSKYGGAIYAYGADGQSVYVNLYIPSVLTWKEKQLTLRMETAYPENGKVHLFIDECPKGEEATVCLRYPAWATAGATLKVNGTGKDISETPGSFIAVRRKWKKGDRIELNLPMPLYTVSMPDNADRRAVFYGPALLAGVFGTEERKQGDIPVFVSEEKNITDCVKPVPGQPLSFTARFPGLHEETPVIPFYKVHDQYQTVYWDVYSPKEWETAEAKRRAEVERLAALDRKTLDYIVLGEMQPERDHSLDGENTRTGEGYLRKYRMAYEGGWFAFDMQCRYSEPVQLILTYYGGDSKKYSFDVVIDGRWNRKADLTAHQDGFAEFVLDIPVEITAGKEKIRIRFQADDRTRVSNIYNCRLVKKTP
ncbi:MAG: glycoside hydrolase family 127 protein [Tannerellaceae bacterium]|nr:glycoside hydrolase family 127 protein [Tannerellaceae bacterium]